MTERRYAIRLVRSARKQLASLPPETARRIARAIDGLAVDPLPPGAKAMKGGLAGHRRIRVGDYRIVYTVEEDALVVEVLRLGHRRESYR